MSSYIWCNECEDCGDISYGSSRIFQCPKCKGERITSYDESDKTDLFHKNRKIRLVDYLSWMEEEE